MIFKFTEKEIFELVKAWLAISLAFTILEGNLFGSNFTKYFIISLIAVGLGFILHELGHKFLAQKYGYQAEFKSFNLMLILGIFMSFLGFIFIAPGAVVIKGLKSIKENGKISLAGPIMNFFLALIFIALFYSNILTELSKYGAFINSWIGLFNLIPFGNIDGSKIIKWNRPVYFSTLILGLILLAVSGEIYGF